MADEAVVVTGTGLVSPLGIGVDAAWEGVLAGRTGLGPYRAMEQAHAFEKPGGEAPLNLQTYRESSIPREAYALRLALSEAMAQAGGAVASDDDMAFPGFAMPYPPHRCGIAIGTTLHGMRAAGRYVRGNDPTELRHFLAPSVLREALAPLAAKGLRLEGFEVTTCSACSSGLGSVLLGVTLLRQGVLDLVLVGGYDPISEYAAGGFDSLRVVSSDRPRPFSANRSGMQVSEGYAVMVLERANDAARRNATALAMVAGGGESSDVHSLTQPSRDGAGTARAIRAALTQADIAIEGSGHGNGSPGIGMVIAHATATQDNDDAEHAALASVFADRLRETPVIGLKSYVGHMLGAAGAGEAVLAIRALREQVIPATAGLDASEVAFDDIHVPTGRATPAPVQASLNLSLGFGGANTAVVLKRDRASPASVRRANQTPASNTEVAVTGIGVVLPGCIGHEAFRAVMRGETAAPWGEGTTEGDSVDIADADLASLINARRARRLSQYVKLGLAAVADAVSMATGEVPDGGPNGGFDESTIGILGTAFGSVGYSLNYYRQIVEQGIAMANPMLFAEGVPNAGAAHVSMHFGIRGGCQTIIGSRTAGLDALRLASLRLKEGTCQRAIVCAAEEYSPLVEETYRALGWLPPGSEGRLGFTSGAVALVLEPCHAVKQRGGTVLGVVEGGEQRRYLPAKGGSLRARMGAAVAACVPNDAEVLLDMSRLRSDALLAHAAKSATGEASAASPVVPNCFTASPLALLAARWLGPSSADAVGPGSSSAPVSESRRFAVLAADPQGLITALHAR